MHRTIPTNAPSVTLVVSTFSPLLHLRAFLPLYYVVVVAGSPPFNNSSVSDSSVDNVHEYFKGSNVHVVSFSLPVKFFLKMVRSFIFRVCCFNRHYLHVPYFVAHPFVDFTESEVLMLSLISAGVPYRCCKRRENWCCCACWPGCVEVESTLGRNELHLSQCGPFTGGRFEHVVDRMHYQRLFRRGGV